MGDEQTRVDRELEAETLMVLGRLAGGIAHDFNNQLTSIIGYADLLLVELPEDSAESAATRQDLMEIRQAAERAHLVTKQLLAFSRPRPAEPTIVNVAGVPIAHLHLLRRLLGGDIRLATTIARDTHERNPSLVRADVSHLGHVLIGLCARARHALPRGGTVTIDVANTTDGNAVRLSVDARGPTEAEEARAPGTPAANPTAPAPDRPRAGAHAPSFAVIEDIVRQSGGRLEIHRDDAQGLHVIIQLPRHRPRVTTDAARTFGDAAHAAAAGDDAEEADLPMPRGIEHVLVVEDDDGVRELVRTTLERYGYQVEVAARPSQALLLASPRALRLDLAILDIVLPEQRGDALAAALIARRPGLRVLHITGREDPGISGTAIPGGAVPFVLHKPFSAAELLVAVRQALDSVPAA